MSELQIENVPLPTKAKLNMPSADWHQHGKRQSYADLRRAFRKMHIGQSVVYIGRHVNVHQNAYRCGILVKARTLDGSPIPIRGPVKLRIWRIK